MRRETRGVGSLIQKLASLFTLSMVFVGCSEWGMGLEPYGPGPGGDSGRADTGEGLETGVEDCDVAVPTEGTVAIPEECKSDGAPTATNPWDVRAEWSYPTTGYGVIVMPAVGQLTDDNGDGFVDDGDIPDIVFTTWYGNTLVALSGDGSGLLFERWGYSGAAGVTIADVDGDELPEILALNTAGQVTALNAAGVPKWVSVAATGHTYPQPAVGDLDGDGDVEVVFDHLVLDGRDGNYLFSLMPGFGTWRTPVLKDLDVDGTMEIILGERVFSHSGELEWASSAVVQGVFVAVVEADGDPGLETFFVTGSWVFVHDDDGTLLGTFAVPAKNPGPPSIADYDGDGAPEIAIAGGGAISVHNMDGTQLWQSTVHDVSGLAGNTGYDFNGDGRYEVLYADETAFRIYDGLTGNVLYENGSHASETLWEYPVVADVDGDGAAEIIVSSNAMFHGSGLGITVYGHVSDQWARSGSNWTHHDFSVPHLNLFRARPTADNVGGPDLVPVFGEACIADCADGPIKVSWSVQNAGSVDQEAGVEAVLYTVGPGAVRTERERVSLPYLPAGTQLSGQVFEIHPTDWEDGLLLRVDETNTFQPYGLSKECREDNNEAYHLESFCD